MCTLRYLTNTRPDVWHQATEMDVWATYRYTSRTPKGFAVQSGRVTKNVYKDPHLPAFWWYSAVSKRQNIHENPRRKCWVNELKP